MQYKVVCEEDKRLIDSAIDSLVKLVCGSKNISMIEHIKQIIKDRVKYVVTYPKGTENQFISEEKGTVGLAEEIEGFGYAVHAFSCKDRGELEYKQMRRTFIHEFCHILTYVLPELVQAPNIEKNSMAYNMTYKNYHGRIVKSNERICTDFGVAFNETMMDLIALWADNKFVKTSADVSVNDIFNKLRYYETTWPGYNPRGYQFFVSLIRLAIVAMSNVWKMNYDELINDGQEIFNVNHTMRNGKKCKANDFLYGILFNPLHIMREYERFMGPGSYEDHCFLLDNVLITKFYTNRQLNWFRVQSDIDRYIFNWQDFFNKKMAYYRQNGMIDDAEYMRLVGRFREAVLNAFDEYKNICAQRQQKQQMQYANNAQTLGG